jgi:hypothetical protein
MKLYYVILSAFAMHLSAMENRAQHIVLLDHQSYLLYRDLIFTAVEIGQTVPGCTNNDAYIELQTIQQRFLNPEIDSYTTFFTEEERQYINQYYNQLIQNPDCNKKYQIALKELTPWAWDDFITAMDFAHNEHMQGYGIEWNETVATFLKNQHVNPDAVKHIKTGVIGIYLSQIKRANTKPQLQS